MKPLVLVTGGTGKTGSRLVSRLHENGIRYRVAARNLKRDTAPFDWNQPITWSRALEDVTAIYLVAPAGNPDPAALMIKFVELAIERAVSRFVLLSASLLPAGGPAMGQVHLWLRQNAREWAVLRPSWFMQNFSEGHHLESIREEGRIYSATGDGPVPFISADDIAEVAQTVLIRQTPVNSDFVLTGGRAINYDEAAEHISSAIGRNVSHRRISAEALAARYRSLGLGAAYAQTLAAMDSAIATGAENRITACVEEMTAHRPVTFEQFAVANATRWRAT